MVRYGKVVSLCRDSPVGRQPRYPGYVARRSTVKREKRRDAKAGAGERAVSDRRQRCRHSAVGGGRGGAVAIPRWEVAIDRTLYGFTISVVVISNETATTLSIGNLYPAAAGWGGRGGGRYVLIHI